MPVVTISREVGSGGTEIGQRVADTLGYRYADKQLIADVLKEYGFLNFERVYESTQSFWDQIDKRTTEVIGMLDKVICALAHHGEIVIMGRGSFAILAGLGDVLNIRIQAPLSYRIHRVMDEKQIADWDTAEEMVQKWDHARKSFVEMAYNVDLSTASLFNLVLDTSKVPIDMAVNMIVDVARSMPLVPPYDAPTIEDIAVDPILLEFIQNRYLAV